MYPEYLQLSLEKVAEHREANTALQPERMTAEEKDVLLKGFHPDYRTDQYTELRAGANKGDKVNTELAETLMGKSRIHVGDVDLSHIDYDVDVLIIGAGGAGCAAAIEADNAGASVLMATKLLSLIHI